MRVRLLGSIIVSTAVIYGCIEPQSPCPDNVADYDGDRLALTGIQDISAFKRLEDNTLIPLTDSEPVSFNRLELHVNNILTAQNRKKQSSAWNAADLFIKSAYACSPLPGFIESKIVGMNLISNASFGPDFGPGISLNSVFFANEVVRQDIEYASTDYSESRTVDNYSPSDPAIAGAAYVLTPSTARTDKQLSPEATELHQFTFSIELANGQLFEIVSDAVLISSANN